MNKLFAIAAVAALASSPALAKTAHQQTHARPAAANAMLNDSPAQDGITAAEAADRNAVYVDGRYAGADPDSNVRLELERSYYSQYYGQ